MRILFLACLLVCLALPVGAEMPPEGQSPEELAEEIKALEAKLKSLKGTVRDLTRKDPVEAQSPSEASPSAGISEEEAKAIAKEAVQEVLASLDENREETEAPSDGEEIDLCSVQAWLGENPGLDPKTLPNAPTISEPAPPCGA